MYTKPACSVYPVYKCLHYVVSFYPLNFCKGLIYKNNISEIMYGVQRATIKSLQPQVASRPVKLVLGKDCFSQSPALLR